jgi:hypothetical protein
MSGTCESIVTSNLDDQLMMKDAGSPLRVFFLLVIRKPLG